jgi:hypothetical protein
MREREREGGGEREREKVMQAWQIEATSDGHVRWVSATVDRGPLRHSPPSQETLGCSMDELLLQGGLSLPPLKYCTLIILRFS